MPELKSHLLYEPYVKYKSFINSCREKSYSEELVLHKHHIIPKHLGGENAQDNLVYLSVEDHILAHFLLADCFEEFSYERRANMFSARLIASKSVVYKNQLNNITNKFYMGSNNPFYGKKHTEETLEKLRKRSSELFRGVDYQSRYGEGAEEEKEKRRAGVKKYWENVSEEEKKSRIEKVSASLKGKLTGSKNPASFPVLVDGIRFETVKDALTHFKYTYVRKLYAKHTVIKLEKNEKSN